MPSCYGQALRSEFLLSIPDIEVAVIRIADLLLVSDTFFVCLEHGHLLGLLQGIEDDHVRIGHILAEVRLVDGEFFVIQLRILGQLLQQGQRTFQVSIQISQIPQCIAIPSRPNLSATAQLR